MSARQAATPKAKAVAPSGGVAKKTPSKTAASPAPAKKAKKEAKKEGGGFCVIM